MLGGKLRKLNLELDFPFLIESATDCECIGNFITISVSSRQP